MIVVALLVPSFVSAKSAPKNYAHGKGTHIGIVRSTVAIKASVQSFPGMTVIQVQPYNPWWRFFKKIPQTTILTISDLPVNTDLQVYTRGYRDHEVKKTDGSGTLSISFPSKDGYEAIIKEKPSTKHIAIDPLLDGPGDDCDQIGAWNATTKTCTLDRNVAETIAIEDSDITLDGAGHTVSFAGGDGIYTDESNVIIKNVTVSNSLRGVVYHDALFTIANGGRVENTVMTGNNTNFTDEGVSSITLTNSTVDHGATGVYLYDQFDGFPTNNISITRVNFKENTTDLLNAGTTFSLSNATDRGNYWDQNTACIQDVTSPSHCKNSYDSGGVTDAFPWFCENGWTITCPVKPPTTTNTPTPTTSSASTPGTNAIIENARSILGAPYQWGAKGFDYASSKFVSANTIVNGNYQFWNIEKIGASGKRGAMDTGLGIDCSGLSLWSYNKDQYGDQKVNFADCLDPNRECKVFFEGANRQYKDNTDRITKDDLKVGDLLFFDTKNDGVAIMDHMALYTGESPYNVIHASGYTHYVTYANYDPTTNELATTNKVGVVQHLQVTDFGRLKMPKISLLIYVKSPVTMIITDPDGLVTSLENPWDGGLEYQVHDVDNNGDLNELAVTGERKMGEYKIQLVPIIGATSTDTYSLVAKAFINGEWKTITLAENVPVDQIPKAPYILKSTESQISLVEKKANICHVPPGNFENPHTITIGQSAVEAHLAHGDTLGECKSAISTSPKPTKKKNK